MCQVVGGGGAAQGKAHGGAGKRERQTEGEEDMGGFDGAGDEQAEPDEAPMSCISSARSRVSPSAGGRERFALLGRRSVA